MRRQIILDIGLTRELLLSEYKAQQLGLKWMMVSFQLGMEECSASATMDFWGAPHGGGWQHSYWRLGKMLPFGAHGNSRYQSLRELISSPNTARVILLRIVHGLEVLKELDWSMSPSSTSKQKMSLMKMARTCLIMMPYWAYPVRGAWNWCVD